MIFHDSLENSKVIRRLALSCTGSQASLALDCGDSGAIPQSLRVRSHSVPRTHAEFIHVGLDDLLAQDRLSLRDIDKLILDVGPGSFTGVRIAVGFAKAFAYLKQASVWTCSSLAVEGSHRAQSTDFILNAIDGMNGSFYFSIFQAAARERQFRVGTPEEVIAHLRNNSKISPENILYLLGSGQSKLFRELTAAGFRVEIEERTQTFAELLLDQHRVQSFFFKKNSWKDIFPLYLRASAAEEKEG